MNGGALVLLAEFSIAQTAKLNHSEGPILG
jgi:hypothetical protein